MGWMVPLIVAARKRREQGDEPCVDIRWTLPLFVVSLLVLLLGLGLFLGIRVPTVALTLVIGGIIVALALVVLLLRLASLLR